MATSDQSLDIFSGRGKETRPGRSAGARTQGAFPTMPWHLDSLVIKIAKPSESVKQGKVGPELRYFKITLADFWRTHFGWQRRNNSSEAAIVQETMQMAWGRGLATSRL